MCPLLDKPEFSEVDLQISIGESHSLAALVSPTLEAIGNHLDAMQAAGSANKFDFMSKPFDSEKLYFTIASNL